LEIHVAVAGHTTIDSHWPVHFHGDSAMVEATTIIGGVFANTRDAHRAVRELRAAGFADEAIGIITRRIDGSLDRDDSKAAENWEEGTGIGAAVGATAGTGLGLAVLAGLLTPIGPVIAGGALIGLLASMGVGATVGSAIGGLVGLGVTQDDADYFERELKSGKTLVTVTTHDDIGEAFDILQRAGGRLRL